MKRLDKTARREINLAARTLRTDRKGLARHLELAEGALRAWEAHGVPAYARLALAAVVAGVEPDRILNGAGKAPSHKGSASTSMTGCIGSNHDEPAPNSSGHD